MRGNARPRPRPRRAYATRHRRPWLEPLEPRTLLAPFTAGNLLVYRLGDGAPLSGSNVATPVFLDEVDPSGNIVQSIAAPISDSGPHHTLTASQIFSVAEGLMTLSADGQYVLLTGYDAAPGTTNLTNSASSTIRRVVGRLDWEGALDTTTAISDGFSGSTIRSAASPDGTSIWVSGSSGANASGGIRFTTFGSTGPTTQISTAVTNTRGLTIAGDQLYVASQVGTHRLSSVGSGTPTTSGQSMLPLPGIPFNLFGNDPQQAFFADLSPTVPGIDTVYVADLAQGLCKFSLVGGTWLPGSSVLRLGGGILSVTGRVEAGAVTLYAVGRTAVQDLNNELLVYTDTTGYRGTLNQQFQTTGYSAGASRRALGVAFVPQAAAPQFDPDPQFAGTAGDDQFILRRAGDNLVLTLGGSTLLDEPAALLNSLTLAAAAGHDRLTVDYSGGDPLPSGGIAFDGGSGNDSLTIAGTRSETAEFSAAGDALTVDGSLLEMSGVETVELLGLATANIGLSGGDNLLSLTGSLTSSGASALILSGTSDTLPIKNVALSGNASVNITTRAGNDAITIAAADTPHGNLNLHIATGLGNDSIQVDGGLSVPGQVSLTSQSIHFNQPASVVWAGGAVLLDAGAGPLLDHWPDLPSVVTPRLDAVAGGAISLGTDVAILAAEATGAGGIQIVEAGAIALEQISTANGPIDITSAGDMFVALISAGGGAADVTLESIAGSVFDDDDDQTVIAVDVLTVNAHDAVGAAGEASQLDTAANAWVLTSTGPGGMWVADIDSVTILSATTFAGQIHLAAAADLTLPVGSLLAAAETATLTSLAGLASGGSTINILGDVDAQSLLVIGSPAADTFNIRPDGDGPGGDVDTPIIIDGLDPQSSPGDALNLDVAGIALESHAIGSAQGSGIFTFVAAASVSYSGIESLLSVGAAIDLVLDMRLSGFENLTSDTDDIFVRLDETGTDLLIDVDGRLAFGGQLSSVRSLTILGSGDNDLLRIEETAGGLPRFSSSAQGGRLNDTSRQLLDFHYPAQGPWNDARVAIHFDGRAGDDSISLKLLDGRDMTYAPDALEATGSGNVFAASAAGPDLVMSFAGVAALHLDSAGGQLLIDATSAVVTTLSLDDDSSPADEWSQASGDGGLATTRFRGFDSLAVVSGSGSQSIDLAALDAATSLCNVTLHGGNTADLLGVGDADTAADRIRLHRTPASAAVLIAAGDGDDLIELGGASNSLDHLLATLHVVGGAGTDRLVVNDSADASADSIVITESSIDGIAGPIAFAGIETLDLTATAGGDLLDATFGPGSDLDLVTVSGAHGDDQFILSTSDETFGGPATGIREIRLFGGDPSGSQPEDGNDTFGQTPPSLIPGTPVGKSVRLIRPSASTLIRIDVGLPMLPNLVPGDRAGDVLNLDATALAGPVLVATTNTSARFPGSAASLAAAPNLLPVEFFGIEDVNLVDRGKLTETAMGDVYLRGTNLAETFRFAPTAHPDLAYLQFAGRNHLLTITARAVVDALGGNDVVEMAMPKGAIFYGGDGDDTLTGHSQADKLVGGAGRDRLDGRTGDNTLWGDWDAVELAQADTLANRQALAEALPGRLPESFFADILTTLGGNSTVYGGPGIDQIATAAGDDWVHAGQGADVVNSGAGHDRLFGGEGNDNLSGGDGDDLADGGAGHDTLRGASGHDVLIGGAGHDVLEGEAGNDALFDGSLRIGGLVANARAKGDAADAALAALLADWRLDFAIGLALVNDFSGADRLRGGTGRDAFSALLSAEIVDLLLLDDRRL